MSTATNIIAHSEGKSNIVREFSYKATADPLGSHDWTMDLFWFDGDIKNGRGLIEWVIEALDEVESIGIWVEDGELTDYDGTMCLPEEAIKLLEQAGITVGEDFRD